MHSGVHLEFEAPLWLRQLSALSQGVCSCLFIVVAPVVGGLVLSLISK